MRRNIASEGSPAPSRASGGSRSTVSGSPTPNRNSGRPSQTRVALSGSFTGGSLGSSLLNSQSVPSALASSPLAQEPTGTPLRGSVSTSAASYSSGGFGTSSPSRGPPPVGINSQNWRRNAGPLPLSAKRSPSSGQNLNKSMSTNRPLPTNSNNMSEGGVSITNGNNMSVNGIAVANGPGPSVVTGAENVVFIAQERSREGANPNHPQFLAQYPDVNNEDDYYANTLPFVAGCTFIVASTPDVNFLHAILQSVYYPKLAYAVTKISFPKMYWFSGVHNNRKVNPYLSFLASLPSVQEVAITLHTAGLTASAWNERDRLKMEQEEFEKSKQLKVIRLQDLCRFYDINRIFHCKTLTAVNLELIHTAMVANYISLGDPVSLYHDLARYIKNGLQEIGSNAIVRATTINPE